MNYVCVKCKNSINANDDKNVKICPICGSYEFEMIILKERPKCSDCGKVYTGDLSVELPFYNATNNSYYCGCYGWN